MLAFIRPRFTIVAALASLALAAGCEARKSETTATTAAPAPASASADIPALLAKADAADGKTDKVVMKCAGCSLHMDGSPDNELVAHDYKLHFCSKMCKEDFAKDPDKSIAEKLQ